MAGIGLPATPGTEYLYLFGTARQTKGSFRCPAFFAMKE